MDVRGTCCRHHVSSPRSGLDASQILSEVTPSLPGPVQLGPKSVQDELLGAVTLWERGEGGQTQIRGEGGSKSQGSPGKMVQHRSLRGPPPPDPVLGTRPVWPPRSFPPRNNHWSHTQGGTHEGRVPALLRQRGPLPDRQRVAGARPPAAGVGEGRQQGPGAGEGAGGGSGRRRRKKRGCERAGGQQGGAGAELVGRRRSQRWRGPRTPFPMAGASSLDPILQTSLLSRVCECARACV